MDKEQEYIQQEHIKTLPQNILCMCGCKISIPAYDDRGRPRMYVAGHNRKGIRKIRDPIRLEINKIKTYDEAMKVIYTQAHIIQELQKQS